MLILRSYLRHLIKNKLYAMVTVLGFAISLTFILLLSAYIDNELSVDDFHINKERIYRMENENVQFSPPIAVDLKNSIPEIADFTRVLDGSERISVADGLKGKFDFLGVDALFFDIFSFPLLKGSAEEVLQSANSIVLSESMAIKLFGAIDVVGKTVFINSEHKFIITGIMEDFPKSTHFSYQDAILNFKAFEDLWGWDDLSESYGFASLSIYFLAKPNVDLPSKSAQILKTFKESYWLYKEGESNIVEFAPLKDLYFSSKVGNGTKSNSKTLIMVLIVIVFLILSMAIGNYVNLTIAQATHRGKEVAIKKLIGATKSKLFIQFIAESVLLCLTAVIVSLFLAKLAEPVFDSLLNTRLHLNNKLGVINLLVLGLLIGFIGIVSGVLPALRISSFKPIEVVKGTLRKKVKGIYGKAFLTFQYTVTIALLACSWIIIKQTDFLRNKDLGFKKDNIVHLDYLGGTEQKNTIKNALTEIPGVEDVSLTWQSPLSGGSNRNFDYNGTSVSFQEFVVDSSFFDVFGIKIKQTDVGYSEEGVYLNEAAVNELGLDNNPVSFTMGEVDKPILGVVKDFNFKELRDNIGPLMLRQQTNETFARDIFIKVNSANLFETVDKIKTSYSGLIDKTEYELTFLDDTINLWYEKEERTGKIISYFTILSFIISAMGILAMSSFYMQQRKKEIGIRKVNGASISEIISLLNKDFVKWVGLAFIIAVPISWYAMRQWLSGFAYKTTMSWWIFVVAGIVSLLLALLTISWQSFSAATNNPVNALREE